MTPRRLIKAIQSDLRGLRGFRNMLTDLAKAERW